MLGTQAFASGNVHPAEIAKGSVLSNEHSDNICRAFTARDVKRAVWSINDNKAPGPDGFSRKFFNATWDITGLDIIKVILDFMENFQKQVNATTLTLIPKEVPPGLIDPCQDAFVAGRPILDNIIVCHDMLKAYNNKRKPPRCTIKVDPRKAYDFLSWDVPLKYDLMLFSYGNTQSVKLLVRALKAFEVRSGLQANTDKVAIYFGNVQSQIQDDILGMSGFVVGEVPFRYLGILSNVKHLKVADYDALIDKMLNKLHCWSIGICHI
uniref:Reverse transcriptase domain-containing protein n=1 Tax=Chenopodium quinoa TaxID=63459 RepID=A0A803MLN0_CHEQI